MRSLIIHNILFICLGITLGFAGLHIDTSYFWIILVLALCIFFNGRYWESK